ncbi:MULTISPECIES: YidC family membrane integrase SpoIIIJ [Heyndrickxia]|uniref:Membrane protein insertase YidC n=1 Tax=Heyndrickxia oleronia TaxID=38875 RepID=A0A8E2LF18_9BACI|nr:YidC family membrane integrase SpoIIIJ [Heyndrickxia oleronia]NYV66324.1 YidC family membrane integrase SpoIIIJ [Bacillus sp. Gen3]MBU5211469.1 YidC family membrane integrase SpoIIIJ [Heyndrickxia oleronia]MCI1592841.1 YidC family membrane integrase SpoIIIJ [Heyndrickxia oleronia]MCI1615645.1 YidC family membrane integrase SpoIIIJ [Heyndrickxia oleronia]MCI1744268.1 YidC family membrane integrase SpoIIIJ [Heyndrickxia oleronia]
MKKRIFLIIAIVGLMTVLAGCTEFNKDITPDSKGFWNEYIVWPLSWVIKEVAKLLGNSYGLSIIVVTIIIRLIILPLMIKQTKSSKAMQVIQPELKKLKEKYSSKDAVTQQKLQQETMKLFQQYGVNPLAGCLPLIIQMPILIGFYHAINRTPAIRESMFLWFDLGSPDYILAFVAGVTTFLQQKVMMAGQDQNPQMAIMLWVMPVMIIVIGVSLPAALPLYWVVGNIFMMIQTYFIKTPALQKDTTTVGKARGVKK